VDKKLRKQDLFILKNKDKFIDEISDDG